MALYVLGYWVGIHFYGMLPQFSTVYFQLNLELTFLHIAVFVKMPFQYNNYVSV